VKTGSIYLYEPTGRAGGPGYLAGYVSVVSTPAGLTAILDNDPANPLADGSPAMVASGQSKQVWTLSTTSTATVNGTTVVATLSGVGRWLMVTAQPSLGTIIEVNFGATPTRTGVFVIVDASVTTQSQVTAFQDGNAATGRPQDENEMDALICRCAVGTGQFTMYVDSLLGPVTGLFRILYTVRH